MKLKMAQNSLFAVLLRSPWWISILIVVLVNLIAYAALPKAYAPYATVSTLPFLVVGIIAAFRQWGALSPKEIVATLDKIRAMPWREFSEVMAEAFRREGYTVTPLERGAADFEVARGGRTAIVSCKRWKAANVGLEPLRELQAVTEAREAQEGIYITTGTVSGNAREFALDNKLRTVQGKELAQMLHPVMGARK